MFALMGAQTYPLLRDTTLRTFREIVPQELIKSYNRSEQHFIFHNNAEVIFRSFDDETKLKSLNLGAAAIEEMTDIPEEVFKMLRTRLRQAGMPCCMYGATNPGTFGNWVYRYFIESPIQNSEVIYSISADNRHLPAEYLQDLAELKKSNPEYYERMVMGKWGMLEGVVYNFPIEQRLKEPPPKHKFNRFIAGLDFGYTHPMAFLIFGCIEGTYYLIDETYLRNQSSSDVVKIVKDKMREFTIDCIYCDSSRPEIIEDLKRAEIPAVEAIKDVWEGIMHVKSLIGGRRLLVAQACAYTLREFDSYIWDQKNTVKEVPIKVNDDCMDAMRYCLYTDFKSGYALAGAFSAGTERETSRMDF